MLITKLLTALVVQNTKHNGKSIDFKTNDIATCKASKTSLLNVEHARLIKYYYHTSKVGALYESTDGPTGQPADNLPISDW